MELKHLKKATHLLEEIQQLDKEIIELDKFAVAIINKEIIASFNLTGTRIEQEEEEGVPGTISLIDADGNATEKFIGFLTNFRSSGFTKPKEPEMQISEALNEAVVFQLLQVILDHKNTQRRELLKQLSRMGVTL